MKKRRKSREEIIEELLRTDENFRRLKERIEYYRAKADAEERRRESS
jgi:hypothetical protein